MERDLGQKRWDLAEAQGWTQMRVTQGHGRTRGGEGYSYGEYLGCAPGESEERIVPDPLHSAEDAEALEAWLVGQGWEVRTVVRTEWAEAALRRTPRTPWSLGDYESIIPRTTDEPDPARRRRRALVEAAWQAAQATRASAAEEA